MRRRSPNEPGMGRDPRWWLMVAATTVTATAITVGLLPGTGLDSDARTGMVLGALVFGGWAVQDTWSWWRRRRDTVSGFVAEVLSALTGTDRRIPPEIQAEAIFHNRAADVLAAEIARLCRRDGLADVHIDPSPTDPRTADVRATAADGTQLVVRVRGYQSGRLVAVGGSLMRAFVAEAVEHEPGTVVHAYATSAGETGGAAFTAPARRTARRYGIVLLPVEALGLWEIGRPPVGLYVVPRTGE
jgi:hypothetical protein